MIAVAPGLEPSGASVDHADSSKTRTVDPPPSLRAEPPVTDFSGVSAPGSADSRTAHVDEAIEAQDRKEARHTTPAASSRVEEIRDGTLLASEKISRCQKLYDALNRNFKDRDQAMGQLHGLTPSQIAELQDCYGKLYPVNSSPLVLKPDSSVEGGVVIVENPHRETPRNLREEMRAKLPEKFQSAIDAAFRGEHELATALQLHYECEGITSDSRLLRIMHDFKGDPVQLERKFMDVNGGSLRDRLDYELNDIDAAFAKSYLNRDRHVQAKERIEACLGLFDGDIDLKRLRDELSSHSPRERARLIASIERENPGQKFAEMMNPFRGLDPNGPLFNLNSRATLREVQALVDNTPEKDGAAQLESAFSHARDWDHRIELTRIEDIFGSSTPAERKAICDGFARHHKQPATGDSEAYVLSELAKCTDKQHQDKFESLIKDGQLSFAQKVHYEKCSLINSSRFESTIKEMTGLTENQLENQRGEYKRRYGVEANFDRDLIEQTSGRLRNEAIRALQGLPEDPVARQITIGYRNIERAKEARQGLASVALDALGSEKGYNVDFRAQEMQQILGEVSRTEQLTTQQLRRICNLNQAMSGDLGMHKEAKQAVTDVAVKTIPTIAVSFVPGGAFASGAVLMRVAVGAGTYVATKAAMEGPENYQKDGVPADGLAGGAVGIGAGVGKGTAKSVEKFVGGTGDQAKRLAGIAGGAAGVAVDEAIKKTGENLSDPDVLADGGVVNAVGKSVGQGITGIPVNLGSKYIPGGKPVQSITKNGGKRVAAGTESGVHEDPEGLRPSDDQIANNSPGGRVTAVVIALQEGPKDRQDTPLVQSSEIAAERMMRDYLLGRTEQLPIEFNPEEQRVLDEMRSRFCALKENHQSTVVSGQDAQIYKHVLERIREHCRINNITTAGSMPESKEASAIPPASGLNTTALGFSTPRFAEVLASQANLHDPANTIHLNSAAPGQGSRVARAEQTTIAAAEILAETQRGPLPTSTLGGIQEMRTTAIRQIASKVPGMDPNAPLETQAAQIEADLESKNLAMNIMPAISANGGYALMGSLVRYDTIGQLPGKQYAVPGFEQAFPEVFEVRAITDSLVPIGVEVDKNGAWRRDFVATLGHKADGEPYALINGGVERPAGEVRDAAIKELGNAVAEKIYGHFDPEAVVFVGTLTIPTSLATGLELRNSFSNMTSLHNVSRPFDFALGILSSGIERDKLSRRIVADAIARVIDTQDLGGKDPTLVSEVRAPQVSMDTLRRFAAKIDRDPIAREEVRAELVAAFRQVHHSVDEVQRN